MTPRDDDRRREDPEDLPDDVEDEIDPVERDEVNRATSSPSFLENPWWRRAVIIVVALVVLSLIIPAVLPAITGNDGPGNQVGQDAEIAPNFTLESANQGTITLSDQLTANDFVVLVFYRTYH